MRTGKDIKRIFIHCTAGYSHLESLKAFWRSLKWKSNGYHILIDVDGHVTHDVPFSKSSNGVKGLNSTSIHIAYVGGVTTRNKNVAADTRTEAQKQAIICAIDEAIEWVRTHGGSKRNLKILGHRDISPDQNLNGKVDSWERVKECPCFEAIPEYKHLLN